MAGNDLAPGRRERKKRATRLALKAAALDLVSVRGFHHVTVEDIADAADVSVRTFFNYFSSKEAAVVGEDDELTELLVAHLVNAAAELSPLEALEAVFRRRVEALSEDIDLSGEGRDVWLCRFQAVKTQPEVLVAYTKHLTKVETALADAMVKRLGGNEDARGYASLVTACAMNAMRVAGAAWAGQNGDRPLQDTLTTYFDLLRHGFQLEVKAA
jgi:AcrR family transcriptional regulator